MASEAVAPQERRARIRIVIADDHRLVLSGLRAALADGRAVRIAGTYRDPPAFVLRALAAEREVTRLAQAQIEA